MVGYYICKELLSQGEGRELNEVICKAAMVEDVGDTQMQPLASTLPLGRGQKSKPCDKWKHSPALVRGPVGAGKSVTSELGGSIANIGSLVKCTRPNMYNVRGRKREEIGYISQESLGTPEPSGSSGHTSIPAVGRQNPTQRVRKTGRGTNSLQVSVRGGPEKHGHFIG